MNCPQTREHLPDLLYGGLAPNVAAEVETHLAGCVGCRGEFDALKQVRQALDAVPPATAVVDLPRLYRVVAQTQERRLRRWRRVAILFAGLAAALVLFAILPSLEFRFEAHQFAVRWGKPPALPQPETSPTPAPHETVNERSQFVSTAPDVEDQLSKLSDLVQLLADSADRRDERLHRELEMLRAQLNDLREQSRQWRLSTERDVAALYAIQFPETPKGKRP
jgi:putative zinc finger protein